MLIENFKVGGLARFGLDYASVAARNPGVVYCSITGFGQTGPYRDRAGYDFVVQAEALADSGEHALSVELSRIAEGGSWLLSAAYFAYE
mgnify:CR=1 FL=1